MFTLVRCRFQSTLLVLLLGTALVGGCSSSGATSPDGRIDLGAMSDSGLAKAEQSSGDRVMPPDGPAPLPCQEALSLSPLQLAADYCVAARFDLSGATPFAFGLRSDRLFTAVASGTASPVTLDVKEYAASAAAPLGAPQPFFTASVTATGQIFASYYLGLTPSGSDAVVGYTLESSQGGVFRGKRGGTPALIDLATGNYSAVFLDETTLLVNGLGLGVAQDGQGVYLSRDGQPARLLIKDLGSYSGHLALTGKALFAGGYFDNEGNKIFGFSLDEVNAAIKNVTQLSAKTDGDLVYGGNVSDTTAVDDDLVVLLMDAAFAVTGASRIAVKVSGNVVSADPPVEVVTVPSGAVSVAKLAAWQSELGLLITGSTAPQVALVRRKP